MKKITLAILGIIAISSQAIMAADCEVCINFTVNNKTDYNFKILDLTQLEASYNRYNAIRGFHEGPSKNLPEVKAHENSTFNIDPVAGNLFYVAQQENRAEEGSFRLGVSYLYALPNGSTTKLSPDSTYNENFKALVGQDESSRNFLYANINITITSKARDDMMVDIPSNGTQFTPYDFEVTISQIGKEEL